MVVIFIILIAHKFLLLTLETAIFLSLFLLSIAILRFYQGYKIHRYQKGLLRLPFYKLMPKDIPVSSTHLFLGRGFRWRQQHTQRLVDTQLSNNTKYLQNGYIFNLVRRKEATNEWLYKLFNTYAPDKTDKAYYRKALHHTLNPFKPLPPVGGNPEIHAVGLYEGEKDIYENLGERVGHKLVLGTTRVGKTRLAEIFITQDIRRGDTTIVFDPKGDAELMLRTFVEAKRVGRPVYIFHLGFPEISCKYNAVGSFGKVTEVAGRISDQLPADGNSAVFRDFAWGFINIVARAMVKIAKTPNFVEINRFVNNIDPLIKLYKEKHLIPNYPELEEQLKLIKDKYLKQEKDGKVFYKKPPKEVDEECYLISKWHQDYNISDDPELDGILTVFRYDTAYYSKLVASLRPLLDKLTTGDITEILSPTIQEKHRPEINWEQIIRQKAVVYIGLDALSDAPVAHAVGASMFADLTSVAGRLYKFGTASGMPTQTKGPKNILSIHADEFNELIGDQFLPLMNKAGGAGYQVTAYTQTISDVEAGIGDRTKAEVIEGNFNTIIMLRVRSKKTAEIFTEKLPEYDVYQLEQQSLTSDSSTPGDDIDFSSRGGSTIKTTKVPALTTADFINLPKGQAFAMIEGGQLYKLRLPLAGKEVFSKRSNIPNKVEEMFKAMLKNYDSEPNYDKTTPIITSPIIDPTK
jgi:conjugative coupling factor TraD (TOL family)